MIGKQGTERKRGTGQISGETKRKSGWNGYHGCGRSTAEADESLRGGIKQPSGREPKGSAVGSVLCLRNERPEVTDILLDLGP